MAQRPRSEERTKVMMVRSVYEPSRIAGECLAQAYAVVVPTMRRPHSAPAARNLPDRAQAAGQLSGGVR